MPLLTGAFGLCGDIFTLRCFVASNAVAFGQSIEVCTWTTKRAKRERMRCGRDVEQRWHRWAHVLEAQT